MPSASLFCCQLSTSSSWSYEVDNKDDENHHMNMEWIRKKAEKKIALKCNMLKLFKFNEDNIVDVSNNMRFFLATTSGATCRSNRLLLL
jgi:hypothetical protein